MYAYFCNMMGYLVLFHVHADYLIIETVLVNLHKQRYMAQISLEWMDKKRERIMKGKSEQLLITTSKKLDAQNIDKFVSYEVHLNVSHVAINWCVEIIVHKYSVCWITA